MANFLDSFNKGLELADQANANRLEIESVFEQLSSQLSEASQGKLKIEILTKSEPIDVSSLVPTDFFKRRTYLAIVASNPLADRYQDEELARWKIAESGYPCKVVMPDGEIYCEDKKGLESALGRLLATPRAGKALQKVMAQKLKAADDDVS